MYNNTVFNNGNNSDVIKTFLKYCEYFHTNLIKTKHIYACIVYLTQILLNTLIVIAQIVLRNVLNTKVYFNFNLIQQNVCYNIVFMIVVMKNDIIILKNNATLCTKLFL